MKYRLTVYAPGESEATFGQQQAGSFMPHATVWAERVKLYGTRRTEAGELFSDYRAEFNIRLGHEVHEGWRVGVAGESVLYEVSAVEPNKERGLLKLICERVNE